MHHSTHIPQKRYGQHFLIDAHWIQKIIQAVSPKREDSLIEIGPGLGALTQPLLSAVDQLDVVELDKNVIPTLILNCGHTDRLRIHAMDALKFHISTVTPLPKKARLIGNLPYNISTPLLFHLLKQKESIQDMHFMLQKEVADRLSAAPHSKDYGRLSVMVQYHCDVQTLFQVGRYAFNPPPKVESSVVRLTPAERYPACAVEKMTEIVRDAFNQRRKVIRNSLKMHISEEALKEIAIDPNARAENLTILDYVTITQQVAK